MCNINVATKCNMFTYTITHINNFQPIALSLMLCCAVKGSKRDHLSAMLCSRQDKLPLPPPNCYALYSMSPQDPTQTNVHRISAYSSGSNAVVFAL